MTVPITEEGLHERGRVRVLPNLLRMLVQPRRTMRRILDGSTDRLVLPLVALAMLSGFVGDLDLGKIRGVFSSPAPAWFLPLIAGILIFVSLVGLLLFYIFAWMTTVVGRMLEGAGRQPDLRAALAWGMAPVIWALIYRVPAVFYWISVHPRRMLVQFDEGRLIIDPAVVEGVSLVALFGFALLELVVFIWWITVTSRAVAEAHGFSSLKGLATILMAAFSPLIVILAIVMAAAGSA